MDVRICLRNVTKDLAAFARKLSPGLVRRASSASRSEVFRINVMLFC